MKVQFKIPKCKGQFGEFDTQLIKGAKTEANPNPSPEDRSEFDRIFHAIVQKGVEAFVNRGGLSKISVMGLEGSELEAAEESAKEIVMKNLAALYSGEIRMVGVKKTRGGDRAVTAEARRIARDLVKQELKRAGLKPSHYSARAITEAADDYISEHPEVVDQAKANLSAKDNLGSKAKIDLSKMAPDPKLVAKSESKKKGKVPLSSTQAGRPRQHA